MRILPSKPFLKKNKELDIGQEILLKKTIELVLTFFLEKSLERVRQVTFGRKKSKTFKWCYLTAGYFFALELPRFDTPA
jgi:hypothetical protein